MNATQRAEWAAIRAEERANRLARKARMAEQLDPTWIAGARAIYDALTAKRYTASLGFGAKQHCVTVRSVKADEKGAVEGISNAALRKADKETPLFAECVHFQSYITITVKFGRAIYELERWLADGDGGTKLVPNARGGFTQIGTPTHDKPLANDDSAYTDPYCIAEKAS